MKFFTKKTLIFINLLMKRFNLLNIFLVILITFAPKQALADIGGLTKCSESPAFEKRLKASVKKTRATIS